MGKAVPGSASLEPPKLFPVRMRSAKVIVPSSTMLLVDYRQ